MTQADPELQLAHCRACGAYTFPADAYGCRRCGRDDTLSAVPLPAPALLRNAVMLHSALAPGLPVPCVIGEVELAPGVVEEALIGVDEAATLSLGMALRAAPRVDADGQRIGWQFVPVATR